MCENCPFKNGTATKSNQFSVLKHIYYFSKTQLEEETLYLKGKKEVKYPYLMSSLEAPPQLLVDGNFTSTDPLKACSRKKFDFTGTPIDKPCNLWLIPQGCIYPQFVQTKLGKVCDVYAFELYVINNTYISSVLLLYLILFCSNFSKCSVLWGICLMACDMRQELKQKLCDLREENVKEKLFRKM